MSEQWEQTSEEPDSLEITEGDNEISRSIRDGDSPQPERRVQQSNYLLASMVVNLDEMDSNCPLWTRGLQRSFKVRQIFEKGKIVSEGLHSAKKPFLTSSFSSNRKSLSFRNGCPHE